MHGLLPNSTESWSGELAESNIMCRGCVGGGKITVRLTLYDIQGGAAAMEDALELSQALSQELIKNNPSRCKVHDVLGTSHRSHIS